MTTPVQPGPRELAAQPHAIAWTPPGPVAAAFEASIALNPIIIGPVGSGKTTTAIKKIAGLGQRVPAVIETVGGRPMKVKRVRVPIVARTYRILWKNVLPSYWKVFPKDWGKWTGGEGEPFVHRFRMQAAADLVLDFHVDGLGVGDASLDDLTRGLEITGAYIYEFDTMPEETIDKFLSRCGRYPKLATGEQQDEVPRQVWCDANAFDPDHWAYKKCFDAPVPEREVFVQPSGRSATAENVQNVGRRYYSELVKVLKPWQTARLVDNKFVPDRPGFLVYPDWNSELHASPVPLEADPTLPLLVGVDPGLKAAAACLQRLQPQVWRCLGELVTPPDQIALAGDFAKRLADMIAQRWPHLSVLAILDPAAGQNNAQTGLAWLQAFAAEWPFPVRLALSNRVKGTNGRVEAVRNCLTRIVNGQPGYLLDPSCPVLRKGFNGAFRFKPMPGNDGVASDQIDKTPESHVQDANQYPIQTIEAAPELMAQAAGGAGRARPSGGGVAAPQIIM